ncbi:hypothetical protein ROSEINA2194_00378 [Roseburia inulinivorans DSM 16841]|uniref:Uncharacterized protein n=1 Tax=Roseburia inulinivorans DSM 16841 TaxID=622312 RepID=C0FNS9_9FIRM|nr:hypothetical protein ROSEINA2194_00378 [Roseburia inulinivorans DSM 16841]
MFFHGCGPDLCKCRNAYFSKSYIGSFPVKLIAVMQFPALCRCCYLIRVSF